jgi:hypothetical protein
VEDNVKRKRGTGKHFKKNHARTMQRGQAKVNQSRDQACMDKFGALIVMAEAFAIAVIYYWTPI